MIVENLQDLGVALEPIPELDVEPRGKISEKDREPREVESGNEVERTVYWTFCTLGVGHWLMVSAPDELLSCSPTSHRNTTDRVVRLTKSWQRPDLADDAGPGCRRGDSKRRALLKGM